MIGDFERFDMQRAPIKQRVFLTPITWLISFPVRWYHRARIKKLGLEGIKPPYLLLCNHNAFIDFTTMTAAIFPHRASYTVAVDGFVHIEWLLRNVGGIGVRKFTNSVMLVKNMIRSRNHGDIIVLFPEARYSLCGTNAPLPDSVGKMIKLLHIPVVTLVMHGHHINSPFWSQEKNRDVIPTEAEMKLLFTAEQTQTMSSDELNKGLRDTLVYDDFRWQYDHRIAVRHPRRAEGLEKVLYQCPHCQVEFHMATKNDAIYCTKCAKVWVMDEYGQLTAESGETEFAHIPDWYEWERSQVRHQIDNGKYYFSSQVRVRSLPNTKGFRDLGLAKLTHDSSGFTLNGEYKGEPYTEQWTARSLYSCHIEYNYLGKYGDCIDLNTRYDTLYLYPQEKYFSVTKISLATEEMYKKEMEILEERESG